MKYLILALLLTAPGLASEPILVYLVRHAEKVDESRDPELSERGRERAREIAAFFEHIQLDHLFASQFKRTRDTLQPLAGARGLNVEVVDAKQPERLIARVRAAKGGTVLIAGHSNTLPDLIARLGAGEVTIADDAYRNLFLVVLTEDGAKLQQFLLDP